MHAAEAMLLASMGWWVIATALLKAIFSTQYFVVHILLSTTKPLVLRVQLNRFALVLTKRIRTRMYEYYVVLQACTYELFDLFVTLIETKLEREAVASSSHSCLDVVGILFYSDRQTLTNSQETWFRLNRIPHRCSKVTLNSWLCFSVVCLPIT